MHDYDIVSSADFGWHANFALLQKSACPVELNSDGSMKFAEENLVYASMDMRTGALIAANNAKLKIEHDTVLDIMGYSSSFWTASIVEDKAVYFLLKSAMVEGNLAGDAVYLNDGGIIDTTGIVTLLQRRVPKIISFYNNNDPLESLSSCFSYLFGVAANTDKMNSLEGHQLGKVFDDELYNEVFANLTDPNIMRAHLTDVVVESNEFLGISLYVLESLTIFSNEYSNEFLDSFDHSDDLKIHLDDRWPNNFPVGIPTFDTNMIAMKADWLVMRYERELKNICDDAD